MNETGLLEVQLAETMPVFESLLLTAFAVFTFLIYRLVWKKIKK